MILGGYTKMWMACFLQESIDEEDIMQWNNKKKLTSYYVHQLEKHSNSGIDAFLSLGIKKQ